MQIIQKKEHIKNYMWEAKPVWMLNICVFTSTSANAHWFYVSKKWFWKFKKIRKHFNIYKNIL